MRLIRSRTVRPVAVLAVVLLSAAGCNAAATESFPLGQVVVVVTDTNNAPVSQIQLNLMLPDKATLWRTAVTGSDGTAQFGSGEGGVLVQSYLVRFPSSIQYALAPGETNDKPVTAIENQTVTVQLKLMKVAPGPA